MINDTIAQAIELQNAGGYCIPFTSFSLQTDSIASGIGSANVLLSGNFTSVKTIFSIVRLQASRDDKTKNFMTGRANHIQAAGYWSYDIAGTKVPQQRVMGSIETFMELQKAFHNFSSVEGHGIHTLDTWNDDDDGSLLLALTSTISVAKLPLLQPVLIFQRLLVISKRISPLLLLPLSFAIPGSILMPSL
jgi:hypothetical protein